MKVDGTKFSNAGWLTSFRFFLVKLIAGESVVILNAHISFIERDPEVAGKFHDASNTLVSNVCFPANEELMLHVTRNKSEAHMRRRQAQRPTANVEPSAQACMGCTGRFGASADYVADALAAWTEPGCPFDPTKHYRAEPGSKITVYGGAKTPVERDERSEFEAWWTENMNLEAMDLWRCDFPMQPRDFVQPYACHETQRGWLAWQARAALEKSTEGASHE